ncbi:MAG: hypothetical protein QF714_03855, partial [Dehalococcoidia bacterium]|nr:hypothetical protein [Dehalococcoidia bacterium]
CLELMGWLRLHEDNRQHILEQVRHSGGVRTVNPEERRSAEQVILRTMKTIGSSREYQFG